MKRKGIKYIFDRKGTISSIFDHYEEIEFNEDYENTDFNKDEYFNDEERKDALHEYLKSLNVMDDEQIINEAKDLGLDIKYMEE